MAKSPHLGFRVREEDEPLLAKLPAAYRQILLLSKTNKGHEMAAQLNVAPGTVKSRLNRARSALVAARAGATP